MNASLKDVAARAGVSVRTVSNVVNDFPHVAPDTRDRVRRALDELGYRPNMAARSLRLGRTGLVALVVPEVDSPYWGELASLLSQEAERHSWTLLIEQTNGDPDRERRLLTGDRAHAIDGLLFSPWALTADDLARHATTVPLVLLGEHAQHGPYDHVVVDNVAAAADATTHLVSLGMRRIAAVGAGADGASETSALRLQGYRQALQDAGLPRDESLEVATRTFHRSEGAIAMRRILASGRPTPDALFCFTDQLALGAMRVAMEHGLRVPEDLAVVGFDDIEDGRYCTPSLTTVAPDKLEIARQAAACLAERLQGGLDGRSYHHLVVRHELIVRESSTDASRRRR